MSVYLNADHFNERSQNLQW